MNIILKRADDIYSAVPKGDSEEHKSNMHCVIAVAF